MGTTNVLYVLAVYAAAPAPSHTPGSPVTGSGLTVSVPAATIIAALVAAVTAVVTALITSHRQKRQVRIAHIQKQLDELYAPIHVLLGQDNELQRQAKAGMPAGTHLLDNIKLVIEDKSRHAIAEQIVAVNKKIVEILEAKSGLSRGKAPDSFAHFTGHHYMLQRSVAGEPVVPDAPFRYFPRQFETDIENGYNSILQKRDRELLPWYRRYRKKSNP